MRIRHPEPADGRALWRLVDEAGTLEVNTPYAYVLLATHFADTCLLAEDDGDGRAKVLGAVVAYRPPTHPEAVFVWQVGVAPRARGRGLASRLLIELLERTAPDGVTHLEATVTPGNAPSRALFEGIADRLDVPCRVEPFLGTELFPGDHEPEDLYRIGPFAPTDIPEIHPAKPPKETH